MNITGQQIIARLVLDCSIKSADVHIADADYFVPSREWVLETFPDWYWKALKAIGAPAEWVRNHDCDNYSDAYHALAQICNARRDPKLEEGVSVGKIWYFVHADQKKAHAINCAFIRSGSGSELIFIEPQSASEITLASNERATIWFARF
ncbi:MAG TPA: hypothetical protein VM223_10705 [Planctomycetota bacterium]|nr:hypothetical protein [Planctomycetota bacterium]